MKKVCPDPRPPVEKILNFFFRMNPSLISFRNCSTVRYNWQATGLLWQLFVTAPCINLVTGDYVNMLPQSVTVG